MKKFIIFIFSFFILVMSSPYVAVTVSATTVEDVIAYARQVGMPEEQIQGYINQYGSRTYTSEQCDKAIGILSSYYSKREKAISEELTPQNSNTQNTLSNENTKEYKDMTIDEKKEYIINLPDEEREDFIANMSNNEKNDFLKNMDVEKQVDILADMVGCGESLGFNFSVNEVSKNAVSIITRDESGTVINITTFGNSVEKTGISYTLPLTVGIILIFSSFAAIIWLIKHCM